MTPTQFLSNEGSLIHIVYLGSYIDDFENRKSIQTSLRVRNQSYTGV